MGESELTEEGEQIMKWVLAEDVIRANADLGPEEAHVSWLAVHSLRQEAVRHALVTNLDERQQEIEKDMELLQNDLSTIRIAKQIAQNTGSNRGFGIKYEGGEPLRVRDYRFMPPATLELGGLVWGTRWTDPEYPRFRDTIGSAAGISKELAGRVAGKLLCYDELQEDYFAFEGRGSEAVLRFKGTGEEVPTKDDLFGFTRDVGDKTVRAVLDLFWTLGRQQEQST